MSGPIHRPRRLRSSPAIRDLVREHRVHPSQLVLPLFLVDGADRREPIDALPGVDRMSVDLASRTIERAMTRGVQSFALFPRVEPHEKTADGSAALREDSLICRALRLLRERFPEVVLIADVALDPYSSHGHDGIVRDGRIANDESVEVLAEMAVLMAQAGASIVAPSDMMDGRVAAIRGSLDRAALTDTVILSYAAKYASSLYGSFRSALGSEPGSAPGVPADKSTYQMDPANTDEAVREAMLDVEEGADILLVKPGLPYLDIVHRLATDTGVPIASYHVSGEYAMLKLAAQRGLVEEGPALLEMLVCFVRAGASLVFTYGALEAAEILAREAHHG